MWLATGSAEKLGYCMVSSENNDHTWYLIRQQEGQLGRGLSKEKIGEFLSKNKPFNIEVLEHFTNFAANGFKGKPVDEALRLFQMYFQMKGEAQDIGRQLEGFSKHYCRCNPSVVANLKSEGDERSQDQVWSLTEFLSVSFSKANKILPHNKPK